MGKVKKMHFSRNFSKFLPITIVEAIGLSMVWQLSTKQEGKWLSQQIIIDQIFSGQCVMRQGQRVNHFVSKSCNQRKNVTIHVPMGNEGIKG